MTSSDTQPGGTGRFPPYWALAGIGLFLGLFSYCALLLNVRSGGITILWPSNGLLLGVLLLTPRRQWLAYIAVGVLVDLGINLSLANPAPISDLSGRLQHGRGSGCSISSLSGACPCSGPHSPRQLCCFWPTESFWPRRSRPSWRHSPCSDFTPIRWRIPSGFGLPPTRLASRPSLPSACPRSRTSISRSSSCPDLSVLLFFFVR